MNRPRGYCLERIRNFTISVIEAHCQCSVKRRIFIQFREPNIDRPRQQPAGKPANLREHLAEGFVQQRMANFAGCPVRAVMQLTSHYDGRSDACMQTNEDEDVGSAARTEFAQCRHVHIVVDADGKSEFVCELVCELHVAPPEYVIGIEDDAVDSARHRDTDDPDVRLGNAGEPICQHTLQVSKDSARVLFRPRRKLAPLQEIASGIDVGKALPLGTEVGTKDMAVATIEFEKSWLSPAPNPGASGAGFHDEGAWDQ